MNAIVVDSAEVDPVRIDESMQLWRYVDGARSPQLDFVMTTLHGRHERRVNHRSHKLYLVLAGSLEIVTDAGRRTLNRDDVAIVPPGVWCELIGAQARVAIACAPALNPNDEEIRGHE